MEADLGQETSTDTQQPCHRQLLTSQLSWLWICKVNGKLAT